MKKSGLLSLLAQMKAVAEDEEIKDIRKLQIMDHLLDYINDPEIREAVEAIPC